MELDLHTFLKGATAGAAGIAAFGVLAACAADQDTTEETTETAGPTNYDISETLGADIVVVGTGTTGCAAAAKAAELGLKTVVVEQAAVTGGTTVMTEGMFGVGTHWQKEAGVNIEIGDLFSKTMDYHHWIPNGEILRTDFNESASNIDWIESLGIKFKAVVPLGMSQQTWHVFETDGGKFEAGLYMDTFNKAVVDLGATVLLNTNAVDIVMSGGKVAGLVYEKQDGTYLRVNAPAVFLGTGGYSDNMDMMSELTGGDPDRLMPMGMGGRKGAGITMAQAVGGVLAPYSGTVMYYGGNLPDIMFGSQLFCASSFQPFFLVNKKGHRFVNEELSENDFSFSGNAQMRQECLVSIVTKDQIDRSLTWMPQLSKRRWPRTTSIVPMVKISNSRRIPRIFIPSRAARTMSLI